MFAHNAVAGRLRGKRLLRSHRFRCFPSLTATVEDDDEASTRPMLEFSNARLSYPSATSSSSLRKAFVTEPFSFAIRAPDLTNEDPRRRQGGYALLGRNGTGKTLLGKALIATTQNINLGETSSSTTTYKANVFVRDGHLTVPASSKWHSRAVTHVSFHSHQELLQERDSKSGETLTAFKAIAIAGGAPGKLSPAAQFLVVRFGLYPLLHRTVDTLSTGEIRKVLLIRALSQRPKLLILDNAFDGLDVPSRDILKDLVSRTLRGFTQDILVQGVSSKATARTQIILMTHRAEEVVEEIDTVAVLERMNDNNDTNTLSSLRFQLLRSHDCDGNTPMSAVDVLYRALGMEQCAKSSDHDIAVLEWHDPTLPSMEDVQHWWNYGKAKESGAEDDLVVRATRLSIKRGEVTLLRNLDWTVRQGERWIVGGGNGAGKSTLSRLLANPKFYQEDVNDASSLQIWPHRGLSESVAVGWVSTESHLMRYEGTKSLHEPEMTARELLEMETNGAAWDQVIAPVLSWLEIMSTPASENDEEFMNKPFHTMSQGQQKLFLLAAAIAKRPPLLILDEPCQGLDLIARQRLLQVVERICSVTNISLIYITHHLTEEQIPSITHALHLKDRMAVYQGSIEQYNPANYYTSSKNKD